MAEKAGSGLAGNIIAGVLVAVLVGLSTVCWQQRGRAMGMIALLGLAAIAWWVVSLTVREFPVVGQYSAVMSGTILLVSALYLLFYESTWVGLSLLHGHLRRSVPMWLVYCAALLTFAAAVLAVSPGGQRTRIHVGRALLVHAPATVGSWLHDLAAAADHALDPRRLAELATTTDSTERISQISRKQRASAKRPEPVEEEGSSHAA